MERQKVVLLVCVIQLYTFALIDYGGACFPRPPPPQPPEPSTTLAPEPEPERQYPHIHYDNAAVATDVPQCSQLGKQILIDGGSAVDAAITSVLCVGVVNQQSSGIGGGFVMVVHIDQSQTTEALMALPRAPQASTSDMFPDRDSSKYGVKTVAIPCEIQGLWKAHQRYGRLDWADVFEPVISLAQNGFQVTKHLAYVLRLTSIKEGYPEIIDMFRNDDGSVKREGDMMTAPILAATLQKIADDPNEIITGTVAQDMVDDIQEADGILTTVDFSSIEATWEPVVSMTFKNDLTMKSPPLTSGGPFLQYILNVMDKYDISSADFVSSNSRRQLYHRFLEATKFGHGRRYNMGDVATEEVQEILESLKSHQYALDTRNAINDNCVTSTDYRLYRDMVTSANQIEPDEDEDEDLDLGDTSHVSVLTANGDAVSVTTSIGYFFGSKFYSSRTGVFLNNQMGNFNYRPNLANSVGPGKRFMITRCPSILFDSEGKVKMVVGASGGTRIISSVAWIILRTLWMDENLKTAIDERRVYTSLPLDLVAYEEKFSSTDRFDPDILENLVEMGHQFKSSSTYAVVQAILADNYGGMDGYSDARKGGLADGY